jgi:hypothetical protein
MFRNILGKYEETQNISMGWPVSEQSGSDIRDK